MFLLAAGFVKLAPVCINAGFHRVLTVAFGLTEGYSPSFGPP